MVHDESQHISDMSVTYPSFFVKFQSVKIEINHADGFFVKKIESILAHFDWSHELFFNEQGMVTLIAAHYFKNNTETFVNISLFQQSDVYWLFVNNFAGDKDFNCPGYTRSETSPVNRLRNAFKCVFGAEISRQITPEKNPFSMWSNPEPVISRQTYDSELSTINFYSTSPDNQLEFKFLLTKIITGLAMHDTSQFDTDETAAFLVAALEQAIEFADRDEVYRAVNDYRYTRIIHRTLMACSLLFSKPIYQDKIRNSTLLVAAINDFCPWTEHCVLTQLKTICADLQQQLQQETPVLGNGP